MRSPHTHKFRIPDRIDAHFCTLRRHTLVLFVPWTGKPLQSLEDLLTCPKSAYDAKKSNLDASKIHNLQENVTMELIVGMEGQDFCFSLTKEEKKVLGLTELDLIKPWTQQGLK